MTIKLLVPDMPNADELLPYLRQIDANRHYTNFGPLNGLLEQKLITYHQHQQPDYPVNLYATSVANATIGLEVIFSALSLPASSKVLMPSLTFPATATAAIRQGLTPIFSSIHPESWLLTPDIAREALLFNPQIQLVVPVATFGTPVDVHAWDQFVDETGIPVVIDAAGAFSNQHVGVNAHVVFSLHATKSLGGGEGGFIMTSNKELVDKIRILSNFGVEPERSGRIYDFGTNAKLSEYHAAVALASLDRWEERKILRMRLLSVWLERLSYLIETDHVSMQQNMGFYTHSLLPIRFNKLNDTSQLMAYLADNQIQTRRWYYPLLPNHPAFAKFETFGDINAAMKLSNELLGLPFHLDLMVSEIDTITSVLYDYLNIADNSLNDERVVA